MEELRSTEILDKEIQEDARKKAERILKNADSECQRIADEVKTRVDASRAEKETLYTQRISLYQRDVDAAVPLEEARFQVSFEDTAVNTAVTKYVQSLTEDKRLFLLKQLLLKYKAPLAGRKADISINRFPKDTIETLVADVLGRQFINSISELSDVQAEEHNAVWGFLIETTDREIRCRVTISEILAGILDSNRFELTSALFGGRLPQ